MRPIGFSTGARALSDFRLALEELQGQVTDSIELSALRYPELRPLLHALGKPSTSLVVFPLHGLVLDRHRVRIHSLLSRHTFQTKENTTIIALVALHNEAAFFIPVHPRDAHVVLLRFAQQHESTDPKTYDG
jgi:hypothetical protein